MPAPSRRPSALFSIVLLLPGLLLALLPSACVRDKGAVLVRWRLVDASTGQGPAQCSAEVATQLLREAAVAGGGACCAGVRSERLGRSADVIIDHIRLRAQAVADVDQVEVKDVACPSCCAACSRFEHTTEFELPPGEYKLWIEPLRCGVKVGNTPPAVVRTVTAGEITNLNSIEVRVDPETTAALSCPTDVDMGISSGCSPAATAGDAGNSSADLLATDAATDASATVPDGG